ncbi:TonB-dependent receptor [Flavobacteriaceae bacterium S356]|uniref:TonB-dependent receptor n=1 Tax=Asprobacillus argus TaxID=3076534 RepID=A0ABU3LC73_9FLAO|nr:TonB-dependent receptor [Flavobacteriaceae bacterium S356]
MRLVVYVVFFLFCLSGYSQQVKVLDKETGKPIYNVTVFNESKSFSSTTDKDGVIDISTAKNEDVLIFSHISYALYRIKKSRIDLRKNVVFLTKESEQLDEVVLSVFKSKNKVARIAEQIAVLTKGEIQQVSPQTSADLLASVPGIKVQKSQFGGGSPVLRGMESNRVLLVVDGVRMNNAIYRKGHLQNSITISPNQLDRTEIVFGPSSVIYGSDALGGVIHYYTKTPSLSEEEEVKSSFFSRFSSVNNEITTNVSAELSFEKWASFTSITYSDFGDLKMGKNRSHGFANWGKVFEYSENTSSFYSANPAVNSDFDLQRNTGYNQTDVLQKFYVPLSKKTDLKLNFQYSTSSDVPRFDRLTELSSGTLKFAEWYYGPQQRLLLSSQLDVNTNKSWMKKATFTAAYQNIKESRIQRRFNSLDRSYREEEVDVFSLNGDFLVPLTEDNRRHLTYGFEFAYNDVHSNAFGRTLAVSGNSVVGSLNDFTVQSRYPDGGSSYTSTALYAGYRQDISDFSTLNFGARFTHTHLEAKWIDQTFITLPQTDITLDNSAATATVGYVYKPNKNWQINSVISSGFRSPNIDDVGRVREKSGNVTVPNMNVKPEFAYNAEVGVQKYFNDRKFKVSGVVYYTLLDNYIIRDHFTVNGSSTILYDGELGNVVANQNRNTAYITGFTASYQGKISNRFSTSGSITFTEGKAYDTGEPLSSIPPLFGQFDVRYKYDSKIEIGANLRFNAKKDITDFNITEGIDNHDLTPIVDENATNELDKYFGSPSWVTLGVNGRYIANNNWTFQGSIDNIFDQHYREFASGISAPGRNFSFSVIANF